MELPKNITQIGETNQRCKVYVEDYVVSYMKQLNHLARDKDMAVALYGIQREENDVSYLFVYGASKLNFLQRETRHLSQAQQQEIEKCRVRYFRDYAFLGYRLLNGEMIEGFHVCEQGICRYIPGYAQFYEKNDSMLAYMLDVREEKAPEVVNLEKYEVARQRQEERRALQEPRHRNETNVAQSSDSGGMRGMRLAVVAVFAFLCLVGISSMNGEDSKLQTMAKQVLDSVMEQQIPDAVNQETLVAEDKLAEAVLKENTPVAETVAVMDMESIVEQVPSTEPVPVVNPEPIVESEPIVEMPPIEEMPPVVEQETVAEPVSYMIKAGDTLISISQQQYGNDERVAEICSLNGIENPDDIKVGQKILLP